MKTKLNFLVILSLVLALIGANTGTAEAYVGDITITPETLPRAEYNKPYSQQLTASGGNGSYTFSLSELSGPLPYEITLSPSGLLSGFTDGTNAKPGTYPIEIRVADDVGATGIGIYDFVLDKGIPSVTIYTPDEAYWNSPFNLHVEAQMDTGMGYYFNLPGTVAFSIDEIPVPGCDTVPYDEGNLGYSCKDVSMLLSVGPHTIAAAYTPDESNADYYTSASNSSVINVQTTYYYVMGSLFRDDDQDGELDDYSEYTLGGSWTVNLDQDCDETVDYTTVTSEYSGNYQFLDIPGGFTYCLSVNADPGYVQTTQVEPFYLSEYIESLDVGFYYPTITISPDELPSGNVGVEYSQTFTPSGGIEPYALTVVESTLPDGFTLTGAGVLSGTPTKALNSFFTVQAEDANQVVGTKTYMLNIKTDGTFTFTASPNPSTADQAVTFTVSATGDAVHDYFGPVPPHGEITFYADGVPIDGCSDLFLNLAYDESLGEPVPANSPAVCTTAALATGTRQITADFTDWTDLYTIPTLALTQTVQPVASIAIGPDTLLGAAYETQYSQQLTASGGTGSYTFSLLSGTLPYGITLSTSGLLSGYPDGNSAMPGTYPITIQVQDANAAIVSRDYNFVLDKGTPTVEPTAPTNIYWNISFNLLSQVQIASPQGSYVLPGTVAFTIDGNSVSGCEAVPYVDFNYLCKDVSMDLSVGTHNFAAAYTPTGGYEAFYNPASASSTFTVNPGSYTIMGSLFKDFDNDGVGDTEDYGIGSGWTVNLDKDCDATVDYTFTIPSLYSLYQFSSIPGGTCLRMTIDGAPGWQQSTTLQDFWLSASLYSKDVGFYYPTIILSPSQLSSGSAGAAYSQVFSASGGAGPYTFTLNGGSLPAGLTLSEGGTLSGTPTAAGSYSFIVQAQDANLAVGEGYYNLIIKADGVFTFTSSSNPSAPGDPVIFTLSATGDGVDPDYGPLPPVGTVTFFDDGTPIAGCSDLKLNFIFGEFDNKILGDYPVTCTAAALAVGTHQITAAYTDYTDAYNTPTLALTQIVQVAVSADLSIGKTDSRDPVRPGAQLVYTLTVSNAGPNAAQSVSIVDMLDRNTTYVSAKAPRGWICTYANSKVTCISNSLASGASAVIKITVTVKKTAQVGKDLVNNASVTSLTYDPVLTNNSVVQKTLVAK